MNIHQGFLFRRWLITGLCILRCATACAELSRENKHEPIRLRAYGVPSDFGMGVSSTIDRQIIESFRAQYPWIEPVSTTGIQLPADKAFDMVPFMQIAGGLGPDVLYVNFRQSHSYIQMKLLYPLDKYVEDLAEISLPDSSALSTEQYIAELQKGIGWPMFEGRVMTQCWPVMRRICPFQVDCRYRKEWGLEPLKEHRHVWAFPVGPMVMGMAYRRNVFAEYLGKGIEMRTPKDWDEMFRWAKLIHDPARSVYGIRMGGTNYGWWFLSFLYSAGGRVVEEQADGVWKCVLDSEAAVEAAWFYARLQLEKFNKNGKEYRGVCLTGVEDSTLGSYEYGMEFRYFDEAFLSNEDTSTAFGPVPAGPTGIRGSEFNSRMCGIFSGLSNDPEKRDAAWKYMVYLDGSAARRIRTERMVEGGLGLFVRPYLLKQFNDGGRYEDVLRQASSGLEESYRLAFEGGVPEPYGKNCQYVYDQMTKPLGEILHNEEIEQAINTNNPEAGKQVIRAILKRATIRMNEKMLGNLPPEVKRLQEFVAWVVIIIVILIFTVVLRLVLRTFRTPETVSGGWQVDKFKWAYILMLPAMLTLLVWVYWPLAHGTLIAFQDYSVLGDSRMVGAQNFASVLFDSEFWYSLRISLVYALLFMFFGFWVPIALAFLISEVPTGKALFRTIYYLPAILSGVLVIFLWQSFYQPTGLINGMLNLGVKFVNQFGAGVEPFNRNWLDNPYTALFFCLLPTVWAGMGPGCLIYLAALKTVPDELYEAADIDGAGIPAKVFDVAMPSIMALVRINFIGAMIGAIRGAGGFILAMTGGGPYGEGGGATEVIGLKLYYTTFGYLQFGPGAAMAWVVGAMLIGFTVIQLQRLSRMEFRTAVK